MRDAEFAAFEAGSQPQQPFYYQQASDLTHPAPLTPTEQYIADRQAAELGEQWAADFKKENPAAEFQREKWATDLQRQQGVLNVQGPVMTSQPSFDLYTAPNTMATYPNDWRPQVMAQQHQGYASAEAFGPPFVAPMIQPNYMPSMHPSHLYGPIPHYQNAAYSIYRQAGMAADQQSYVEKMDEATLEAAFVRMEKELIERSPSHAAEEASKKKKAAQKTAAANPDPGPTHNTPHQITQSSPVLVSARVLVPDEVARGDVNGQTQLADESSTNTEAAHINSGDIRAATPINQVKQPSAEKMDELRRTAGNLLASVASNKSEKFQKSEFFGLMRKISTGKVILDGTEFREVDVPETSLASASEQEPAKDSYWQPDETEMVGHRQALHPGGKKYPGTTSQAQSAKKVSNQHKYDHWASGGLGSEDAQVNEGPALADRFGRFGIHDAA